MQEKDKDTKDKLVNLLVAFTGSVATIKDTELLLKLKATGKFSIRAMYTQKAMHFLTQKRDGLEDVLIFTDQDEWKWAERSDPVLHIELRKWADLLLIAPLSANTLAKISNGLCDNLVTCVVRAWDMDTRYMGEELILKKPVIVAPAMNTMMWVHPFTEKQLKIIREELYFQVIEPISKKLVCGDIGKGAMADIQTIVDRVLSIVDFLGPK